MLHLQGVPESPFSPFSPYEILHFRANPFIRQIMSRPVIITTEALSVLCQPSELTQRKVTFLGLTFSPGHPFKLTLMGIPGVAPQTFCETWINLICKNDFDGNIWVLIWVIAEPWTSASTARIYIQTLQTKAHLILSQYHEQKVKNVTAVS